MLTRRPTQPSQSTRSSTASLPRSKPETDAKRVLDFDVETIAAGFADPNWVPQKITCVAWSWIGSDEVHSRVCGPLGLFGKPDLRAEMLSALLEQINSADMLTGHNIERFDLPVINAECMRLDLPPIRNVLVQDTMRVLRSKGFKKGQDVLAHLFDVNTQKLPLDWQEWQEAYDEDDWQMIRKRAETDVMGHKEIRRELLERRILKHPRLWRG